MYSGIALFNPKNHINVGSVLRAAYCFDSSFVAILSGNRYRKSLTDTVSAHRHLPLFHAQNLKDIIPFDCIPVAVDLVEGAVPLQDYEHPKQAIYVFGSEDSTLGKQILDVCRDKIYIPMRQCLNLAACVNVVLYDRAVKLGTLSHALKGVDP